MKILNFSLIFFFSISLFSVPQFSKKYEISCSSCHTIAPDLNTTGEKFLKYGYKFNENKDFKRKIDTGDSFLYLLDQVPLSFLINLYTVALEKEEINYNTGKIEIKETLDFQYPYAFKLISGGILYKNISYYVSFLNQRDISSSIYDAFILLNLSKKFPLSLKFGQFQVSDQLFKSNLRLEENFYEIYLSIPSYSYSYTNLYYDKGIQFIFSKNNWEGIFGVYNGYSRFQLIPGQILYADDFNYGSDDLVYDNDLSKNYSFRLKKSSSNFDFGLFYMIGRNNWKLYFCDHQCGYKNFKNRLSYSGVDFSIKIKEKFKINFQYLNRRDDNLFIYPLYNPEFFESELNGGFLEILYFPKGFDGKAVFSLLYNKGNSDLPEFSFGNKTQEYYELDFSNLSFCLNYLLSRNVKILGELKRDFTKEKNKFTLGFIAYF